MTLRVIDAGPVSAVRSQALWHGIADAMRAGEDPVLSFCRPAEAYVCLGYHRRLDELDLGACQAHGLSVLRRQLGGGPVYLDGDQLFFQVIVPSAGAPAGAQRLYETLLEPAAAAFRALGVDSQLAAVNDIVAGGRKISGTGAGQIGEGVVVVGNVMFAFPVDRMAAVLQVPDASMRAECLRLMRAHLGTLPQLRADAVRDALMASYSAALGRRARPGGLTFAEQNAVVAWERRMLEPGWLAGPALPVAAGRQVKVRAGVFVYDGADGDVRVRVSVEDGVVRRAEIHAPARPVPGRRSPGRSWVRRRAVRLWQRGCASSARMG